MWFLKIQAKWLISYVLHSMDFLTVMHSLVSSPFFVFKKKIITNALKVNIFQGITLPDAPKFGKVFGGQLVGQVGQLHSLFPLFLCTYHTTTLFILYYCNATN